MNAHQIQSTGVYHVLILLCSLLLAIAACLPTAGAPAVEPTVLVPAATNTPAPDEPASSDTPQPTETDVPIEEPAVIEMPDACFPETEQYAPFINVGDGYCVQYAVQEGFRVKDVFPGIAAIWGQPLTPDFEPVRSGLTIVKQGTAAGRSLDEIVAEVLAQNPDTEIVDASATFAGEPAQIVEGIPGMMEGRHYYTIHNDFVYEITLVPINEQGELAEEVGAQRDLLWQTAMNTFTWLPQNVLEQFSECPVGTQEASPYVNVANAYCLLYPSHFRQQYLYSQGEVLFFSPAVDPTIPEPVRALLHVAVPEAASGRSLEQVVDDVVAEYEICALVKQNLAGSQLNHAN